MTDHLNATKPGKDDKSNNNRKLTVTVRTPAGIIRGFDVKSHDRVDKTIATAVKVFVEAGELAEGNYGLALVRDGVATDMADAGRLDDYGVVDGDELHLFNTDPQVDG